MKIAAVILPLCWAVVASGCCSLKTCAVYASDDEAERFRVRATFIDWDAHRYVAIRGKLKDRLPFSFDTGYRHTLSLRVELAEAQRGRWRTGVEGVMVTSGFRTPTVRPITDVELAWSQVNESEGRLSGTITVLESDDGRTSRLRLDDLVVRHDFERKPHLLPASEWRHDQRLAQELK